MTLYPVVKNPTRVTDKTATLIDNILTNSTSLLTCGVMTADVADHLCPFAISNVKKTPKNNELVFKWVRQTKPENIEKLRDDMSRQNWTEVLVSTDVNEKAQKFHDIMVSKLDQFCPMKKRKMNKNVDIMTESFGVFIIVHFISDV